MSNAAIGCLSYGTRSERHRRTTAAEHSFGSSLFKRVTQTVRDYLRSSRIIIYGVCKLLGKRSVWLPDANAYAYRMLSEGPRMNNSLRQ